MRKVTIKQVAEAAGVSIATVSRVMNENPEVSAKTRDHVQKYIDAMGYAPNAIARSLIQGRSNILGVVSTGICYYGPSQTLAGIEAQANELGYSLMLSLLHNPVEDTGQHALEQLIARQVDGILWAVPEISNNRDWICRQVAKQEIPTIFLSMSVNSALSIVAADNYAGARLAVGHLIRLGYRRIGHIAAPDIWWEAQQRQQGWHDALSGAGIVGLPLAEGDWTAASGQLAMLRLFDQSPGIEAVFASNDQMALGALKAAALTGRRVPDDLAVVGFDNIPEAPYFTPSLTTVKQDLKRLGAEAVLMLDRSLIAARENRRLEPGIIQIRPELLIRDSCGSALRTTS
jgi:LacI family transcriptional regulator